MHLQAALLVAALAAPTPQSGPALVPTQELSDSSATYVPKAEDVPRMAQNWSTATGNAMPTWGNWTAAGEPLPTWSNWSALTGTKLPKPDSGPAPSKQEVAPAPKPGVGFSPLNNTVAKIRSVMGNESEPHMRNFSAQLPAHGHHYSARSNEPSDEAPSEGAKAAKDAAAAKAADDAEAAKAAEHAAAAAKADADIAKKEAAEKKMKAKAEAEKKAADADAAKRAAAVAASTAAKAAYIADTTAKEAAAKAAAALAAADASKRSMVPATRVNAHAPKSLNATFRINSTVPTQKMNASFAPFYGATNVAQAHATTDCGEIAGVTSAAVDGHSMVDIFHGVKYAFAKRWEPPVSLVTAGLCWAPATFDASVRPLPCIGLDGLGNEDCLVMTIYTPTQRAPAPTMPIVAYFHGGDLVSGSVEGESEAEGVIQNFGLPATWRTGMVWADINYRIGLAGFLSTDAMGDVGQFGFLDALESIRWLNKNGAAFGGNPAMLTVMGQSSGGTVALILAASPLSRGLFSRVISLSAGANVSMTRDVQRRQHAVIIQGAGCALPTAEATMACLKSMPLTRESPLVKATPKSLDSHAPGTEVSPSWSNLAEWDIPRHPDGMRDPGLAVVDGYVLRKPLWEALAQDADPSVSIIISSMAQEQGGAAPFLYKVGGLDAEQFRESLRESFAYNDAASAPVPFGYKVYDQYLKEIAISPVYAAYTIASDVEVGCGNLNTARGAASLPGRSAPVYFVHNEMHKPGVPTGGTCDAGTAFHGLDLGQTTMSTTPRAKHMRDYWYEFTTTGRIATWQPTGLDPNAFSTVRLNMDGLPNNVVNWKGQRCDFWKAYGLGGPEQWWSN